MIQPVFGAMITALLARFILNDLPHAAGLFGEAPKPLWFTHSSAYWQDILQDGYIKPDPTADFIPVSFDGAWFRYTYGDYPSAEQKLFVFPLEELFRYRAKPVFYLGTTPVFETEEFDRFGVMDMVCLFAMETWVLEPIPVTERNLVPRLLPTRLIAYTDATVRELKDFGRAHMDEYFAGTRDIAFEPNDRQARVIHGYNRMVASLFGLDYSQVLSETEKRIAGEPDAVWRRWWAQ